MIRSICLISQEYPPDTAYGGIARVVEMAARSLAEAGVAVHVITLDPTGRGRTSLAHGVVVHRVPAPAATLPPDMPYVTAGIWSQAVAQRYRELDELIGFDVVQVQDYAAESLHLGRRPETPLVVYLHGVMSLVSRFSGQPRTPGQRAFDALEIIALRSADALLAPSPLVLEETRALVPPPLPPAQVAPPQFDVGRFACPPRTFDGGPLRVLFLGRLEPLKGPDLAIRAAAAARQRGLDVQLTLLGRDIPDAAGRSMRREILLPLAHGLGLDLGDVRFVEQRDEAGVLQHLRSSHCALLPSRFENVHIAAVEALASGIPAITGSQSGLAHWVAPEDGLRTISVDDPEHFAELAAEALGNSAWLGEAGQRGARRVGQLFDPGSVSAAHLQLYERLVHDRRGAQVTRPRAAAAPGPSIAIVVLAHNALAYTQRCLRSLLAHTSTPFHLYVVDNASTDGTADWAASLDPRVTLVRSDVNRGVSGGRNLGLAAISSSGASYEYVVFLDNDVEVAADWWAPFVAALEQDPSAGIAGEQGVNLAFHAQGRSAQPVVEPGPVSSDMVIGYCMVMRTSAVRQIGRFDEHLGLFWHDDDDYCLRAKRLGYRVLHVRSGRVLHFEHKSSSSVAGIWSASETPSELSQRNQRYLSAKWQQAIRGTRTFVALAQVDELVEHPEMLAAYGRWFTDADDATLLVYAPDWSLDAVARQLAGLVGEAGLDRESSADVLTIAAPRDPQQERLLASAADVIYTRRIPSGVFQAPPHFSDSQVDEMREVALRRWAATSPAPLAA